jgi:hypothetical protein
MAMEGVVNKKNHSAYIGKTENFMPLPHIGARIFNGRAALGIPH